MEATIVGGGVSGLTTGVALAEAGWDTRIITRERAHDATSVIAAAVWFPVPDQRAFMAHSMGVFRTLVDNDASGVFELDITEYSAEALDPNPAWAEDLRHFRLIEDVPEPFGGAQVMGSVRVEPPVYLTYLEKRFEQAGGSLESGEVASLGVLPGDVVVNCSGLGSIHLAGDESMFPVRGQVVHVENVGITEGLLVETPGQPFTYVLPRTEVVVLGGTRWADAWSLEPDDDETQRILRDARRLDERLVDAALVDVQVGLRPGRRDGLRVEREGRVIHNYGHDGNGYGLSWGCAAEVVRLATS